jgi:hypothetical protein
VSYVLIHKTACPVAVVRPDEDEKQRLWGDGSMRDGSLRRGTDRVEDALAWLLMALGMIVLIGAVTVGVGVYTQSMDRSRADQSVRVQATAVLLVDASDKVADQGSAALFAGVPARWTDSVGRQHEDEVLARLDSRAGDQVSIWLDRDGDLTSPPGSALSVALDGLVIGIVVLGLGCSLIAAVWMGLRRIIFNRNARAWEREWARVGPEWTSQRPT